MNEVKSKYQNPDKFIERLKDAIAEEKCQSAGFALSFDVTVGKLLLSGPGMPKVTDCDIYGSCFDDCVPGDRLSIVCEVTSVGKSFKKMAIGRQRTSQITMSPIQIRTRGTR